MTLLGGYELIRRLGQGSMGEVWEAHDVQLGRAVAVKLLSHTGPEDVARFKREARMASRLSHPNIATLYEVGEADGRPFIAMQKIDGAPLGSDGLPPRRRVEALRDAARAVHYAHEQGIIHRDLKPDNILVDGQGRAFVLDFGLARPLVGGAEDPMASSLSGRVVGTPAFMPPEQALGHRHEVGVRSDVFGLGATLYFALTGSPPFTGRTDVDVLRAAIHDDPAPSGTADRDLMTISLKALEKDPARRYATAEELADELDRWLRGEPIRARPPGVVDRLRKHVRREPVLWTLGAALAATIVIGAGWSLTALLRQQAELKKANVAERERKEAQERAREDGERVLASLRRVESLEGAGAELDDIEGVLRTRLPDAELQAMRERLRKLLARLDADLREADEEGGLHYLKGRALRLLEQDEPALDALGRVKGREATPWGAATNVGARAAYERFRVLLNLLIDTRVHFADKEGITQSELATKNLHPRLVEEKGNVGEGLLPEEDEALVRIWVEVIASRYTDKAKALTEAELARGGRTADLLFMHGLFGSGDAAGILAGLDRAIERDAGRPRFYFMRGHFRMLQGRVEEALADLTEAIRLKPDYFVAFQGRMAAHKRLDRLAEALADAEAALRIHPDEPHALAGRSARLWDLKRFDEALKDAERALAVNPHVATALRTKGLVLAGRGDNKGAVDAFTRELVESPSDTLALLNRGRAYKALGRHDLALADADAAIAIRDTPEARVLRGNVHFSRGDFRRAVGEYDAALALDPKEQVALSNRASAHYTLGDDVAALKDADAALALNPEDGRAYMTRGAVRARLSRFEEAIADLTEAEKRLPPDAEILASRGFAYANLKRYAEALADLEKADAIAPATWPAREDVRRRIEEFRRAVGGSDF